MTARPVRAMVMAIGLNSFIGWVEHKVAPWQAEITGRDRD